MGFKAYLGEIFAAQRENTTLWLPVFLGLGICAYFGLKTEPGFDVTLLALSISFVFWMTNILVTRKTGLYGEYLLLTAMIFVMALGFSVSKIRTITRDHPILQKPIRMTMVEGTVQSMELLEEGKGIRVLLEDVTIEKLDQSATPYLIRLTIRKNSGLIPGHRIRVLAGLNPPSQPVAPGSFDFQRDAYFKGIGAFGFAYKPPEIIESYSSEGFMQRLQQYRLMLGHRAEEKTSSPESSVVIALLNGDQRALPDETWDDIRIAGLAHIIAISGANISMAAGIAFFLSRFLMALWPRFALYHPIKVYSSGIAFVAAFAYALIVGMNIPTFRALIMTGLVLLAIAINRSPFSLRMAAMSAFGLLLFYPEFLLGASFQMSFAAVIGLIVFYDKTRNWWTGMYRRANWFGRGLIYIGGIMAVTVLATIVTAPFSLANFQQFSTYGVIANAIVVPVVDFWIMPLAIIIYFLAPLNIESWAMHGMEAGVHFMLSVAHTVAEWPYSQLHGVIWPHGMLGMMVTGVLFTIIWIGRFRWVGLVLIAIAVLMVVRHQPPDVLVAPGGKLALINPGDGSALLSTRRSGRFISDVWIKESGIDGQDVILWPKEGVIERNKTRLACEKDGCFANMKGASIAFSFNPRTLAEDCAQTKIVFSTTPFKQKNCQSSFLADMWDLKDKGTHAIWINNGQATIKTVAGEQGNRPWTTKSKYIDND